MLIIPYWTANTNVPSVGVIHNGEVCPIVGDDGQPLHLLETCLDTLVERCDRALAAAPLAMAEIAPAPLPQAPIWAAGVTYRRSQQARMEESQQKDAYDRVYDADRPEIFLKSPGPAVADGGTITIRSDSTWDVPEPELTLVINNHGEVLGYTIGNDVSSRSIEGENPLYLPQAKIWEGSAAIGPSIRLATVDADPLSFEVELRIARHGETAFTGNTSTSQLHRRIADLVDWLHRGNTFPHGVYLMTGTGIVPPDDFTLQSGDEVAITIDGIGQLTNRVATLNVKTNRLDPQEQ